MKSIVPGFTPISCSPLIASYSRAIFLPASSPRSGYTVPAVMSIRSRTKISLLAGTTSSPSITFILAAANSGRYSDTGLYMSIMPLSISISTATEVIGLVMEKQRNIVLWDIS